jgi:hypothetical protein
VQADISVYFPLLSSMMMIRFLAFFFPGWRDVEEGLNFLLLIVRFPVMLLPWLVSDVREIVSLLYGWLLSVLVVVFPFPFPLWHEVGHAVLVGGK